MIFFLWLRGKFDLPKYVIMRQKKNLADFNHPLVVQKAKELTRGVDTYRGKIERLFYYVRDEIKFGFLAESDFLTASDVIKRKMGQCNNKGILFFSLCKALDIPVRMHFSIIGKEILRGLFNGFAYWMLPEQLSHCWVEVLLEEKWRSIDSYICDEEYYRVAKKDLSFRNRDAEYPRACTWAGSGRAFTIDEERSVQKAALVLDQGLYDDPTDYFYSRRYINKVFFVKFFINQHIISPRVNGRVNMMRESCSTGLC